MVVDPHYIPTGEGESAEGMRERHRMQQAGEYHPKVQGNVDDILGRIESLLAKSRTCEKQ